MGAKGDCRLFGVCLVPFKVAGTINVAGKIPESGVPNPVVTEDSNSYNTDNAQYCRRYFDSFYHEQITRTNTSSQSKQHHEYVKYATFESFHSLSPLSSTIIIRQDHESLQTESNVYF